jgi:DNA-binding LacI/PurR family transcriptional regulator
MKHTAVVVANDHMAITFMKAVKDKGYGVPDRVSVTGLDDSAMSKVNRLTTVGLSSESIGDSIVQLLQSRLQGSSDSGFTEIVCAPNLLIRETTAPPYYSGPPAYPLGDPRVPASPPLS